MNACLVRALRLVLSADAEAQPSPSNKARGRQAKKRRSRASRPMAVPDFRGLRFEELEGRCLLSVGTPPHLNTTAQVIYSQNSQPFSGVKGYVDTMQAGQASQPGLSVVCWAGNYPLGGPLPQDSLLNQPINWKTGNVGDFTGFYPAGPGTQVGLPGSCASRGSTAVQIQGAEIGVLINSNDFLDKQGFYPHSPMCLAPQVEFPNPVQVFSQSSAFVAASFDLQVPSSFVTSPSASAPVPSSNQIVAYFSFTEKTTGQTIAFGAQVWDSRGTNGGEGNSVFVDPGTGSSVVLTPISSGGAYNTVLAESSPFQPKPWTGLKHFVFTISATNMLNAINAVNANNSRSSTKPFPTQLANYSLTAFQIDSEIAYSNTPASFGYSVANINIAAAPTLALLGNFEATLVAKPLL